MNEQSQIHWLIVALATITLLPASSTQAQPANDDCINAITVTEGVYQGSNLGSTGDGFGTCGSSFGSDVWYKYTAPANGQLFAHLCAGADYDTVIGLWNGCPLDGGAELKCNDDSCGQHRSSTNLDVIASQQVWIRVSGYEGDSGHFTLTVHLAPFAPPNGPDVVYSDLTEVVSYPPVGSIHAYSADSHTCNIGDQPLQWGGTPLITWNAYRLANGRFEQIGLSWVKSGIFAAAGPGCGQTCSGDGGPVLGAGCKDVYSAEFNAGQGGLGPRSAVNAFTGAYTGASGACAGSDTVCKRLQIAASDLNANQFPDGLFFFEGVFVAGDDAASGHALNNASYKHVSVAPDFTIAPAGPIAVGHAAIEAWHDHGLGLNTPDPEVVIGNIDVPSEGRFVYGYHVRDLGDGHWRYDYAVFNLNSDRSGRSFSVPVPLSVSVSNIGFHDVSYHSGEPFDGTDWVAVVNSSSITWTCAQTFQQNPNANALRYGTLYNFGFDATAGPTTAVASIGLFRPGSPDSVQGLVLSPAAPVGPCQPPGDVNGDSLLNGMDVQHFVNCALTGSSPGGDCTCADMDHSGSINSADIALFVTALRG